MTPPMPCQLAGTREGYTMRFEISSMASFKSGIDERLISSKLACRLNHVSCRLVY